MDEPLIGLAFSVHSNKGAYALLVGSGVSRSSGIPTGWEIVEDLIRRIAEMKDQECEPDPAGWYETVFDEPPRYDVLIDAIAKTPAERNRLLRRYFEPTEEEREEGKKLPTQAHKAIAQLVAKGYVRVIVTTNFDHLLEDALKKGGIEPTVISTPEAAEGAIPVTHEVCSIVKVHGDYQDVRIKTTPDELATYDRHTNRLLDKIFDEFGLVVCGWSGSYDKALRKALERCKSHRFSIYWTIKGDAEKVTQKLIKLRRATVIRISDADSFFRELEENVHALDDVTRAHPVSSKIAVAMLKRYIGDEREKVRVFDLVKEETERVYAAVGEAHFPVQAIAPDGKGLAERCQRYEGIIGTLLDMMVIGCYHGEGIHQRTWVMSLQRVANPPLQRHGQENLLRLRLYPALVLFYGASIAALAGEKYSTLAGLILKTRVEKPYEGQSLVWNLSLDSVMDFSYQDVVFGKRRLHTGLSDHLFEFLRGPLRPILSEDAHYEECFDRLEYLYGLLYLDCRLEKSKDAWAPLGRFWCKSADELGTRWVPRIVETEIRENGPEWPLVKFGLFGGSSERLELVRTGFNDFLEKCRREYLIC